MTSRRRPPGVSAVALTQSLHAPLLHEVAVEERATSAIAAGSFSAAPPQPHAASSAPPDSAPVSSAREAMRGGGCIGDAYAP